MTCLDLIELSTAVRELVAEAPEAAGHWRLSLFKMIEDSEGVVDGISESDSKFDKVEF